MLNRTRCAVCDTEAFFATSDHATCMGHIYSLAGLREWDISQTCEYCFDEITSEDEDEYLGDERD